MRDKTAKLIELDQEYLWYPFTQMKGWLEREPVIIERGEGFYLIDTEGRRYIDGVSSLWCNVHGHRVKKIDDAIRQQLERIAHSTLLGLGQDKAIELAEKLVKLAGGKLKRVFYSDSGATSVEIAIKMAYQYWRNKGVSASFYKAAYNVLGNSGASFLARVSRSKSSMMFAILKSGRPCCRVLKNSPGPRSLRSCSAILKPSLVLTMISRRLCAVSFSVSEKSRQYASCFPRPMRPRS